MLQNAAELCSLLVRDIYGDLSSKVVAVLLEYGRTSLPPLFRRVKLPEKIVKQTLVVLIQQHLVLHYTHDDGGRDTTYYECDWLQIYELLHSGRIIRIVEERFGHDAASIVSNLLLLGHARVSDFIGAYGVSTKAKSNASIANGTGITAHEATGTTPITSTATIMKLLVNLIQERYLVPVQQHHMQPLVDTENAIRTKATLEQGAAGATAAKAKKAIEEKVVERMELLMAVDDKAMGLKRKLDDGDGGRARKKARYSGYGRDDEDTWEIDGNIVLRINHDKFLAIFRNAELVQWVDQRIGRPTSLVYAELLRHIDKHYSSQRTSSGIVQSGKKKIISTLDISNTLSKDIDLSSSIVEGIRLPNGNSHGNKRAKTNGMGDHDEDEDEDEDELDEDDYHDSDAEGEDFTNGLHSGLNNGKGNLSASEEKKKHLNQIRRHLSLLAEDSLHFVTKEEGSMNYGGWSVDFESLTKSSRSRELEKIVEERFGGIATRLLRIIKDKGKLDEKQLADIALLKQKDIRSHLASLHERGHLHIQEIPKTNDRAPSRTLFLFYFDEKLAGKGLLNEFYKGMSRIMQRLDHERSLNAMLLAKADRTDVKGNEDTLLTKKEREQLDKWKKTEEKLLGQVMRIDKQVMMFRDW